MKKIILPLLPVFALAACGEEPAPAPEAEAAEAVVEAPVEPALPAPNQEIFSTVSRRHARAQSRLTPLPAVVQAWAVTT